MKINLLCRSFASNAFLQRPVGTDKMEILHLWSWRDSNQLTHECVDYHDQVSHSSWFNSRNIYLRNNLKLSKFSNIMRNMHNDFCRNFLFLIAILALALSKENHTKWNEWNLKMQKRWLFCSKFFILNEDKCMQNW